jgi:OmpA-OmpF porin, OOP family
VLKPESRPQLAEMAKLLKAHPALKVHIVGHTDNQVGVPANLALSQQRADAVVAALVQENQLDPKRMTARGLGSFAPVASNSVEAGCAKNRRVELVEQ